MQDFHGFPQHCTCDESQRQLWPCSDLDLSAMDARELRVQLTPQGARPERFSRGPSDIVKPNHAKPIDKTYMKHIHTYTYTYYIYVYLTLTLYLPTCKHASEPQNDSE